MPKKLKNKNITAHDVAERLISICLDHGDLLTNLKLQRLLYYAQAWHLALYDRPLFPDRFAAWATGPIQPEVYETHGGCGDGPLARPIRSIVLTKKREQHLCDVLEAYGDMSSFTLERLSMDEEPWREARRGLHSAEASTNVIGHATMRRFYKAAKKRTRKESRSECKRRNCELRQ